MRRATSRAGALSLVGVLAAVAIIAAAAKTVGSRADAEGPLATYDASTESTFSLYAGTAVTHSEIEVWNEGSRPVVLERLVPVEPDPEIEVLGVLVAPSPERGLIAGYDSFPPDPSQEMPLELPELAPIEGYVVPPGPRRTQLYVGVRSTRDKGLVRIPAFEVEYRVDDDRHRLTIQVGVAICTPKMTWSGFECPSAGP